MNTLRIVTLIAALGVAVVAGRAGAQALRPGAPAPDVAGSHWINSPPLTIEGLRGRVVAVEFWTFG